MKKEEITKDEAIIEIGKTAEFIRETIQGICHAILIIGIIFILLAAYLIYIEPKIHNYGCGKNPSKIGCITTVITAPIPSDDRAYVQCYDSNDQELFFENWNEVLVFQQITGRTVKECNAHG